MSRRAYHREYYHQNIERRRRQKVSSKRRLGKAHRYLLELKYCGQPQKGDDGT